MTLDDTGVVLAPGLHLSFQRYARPSDGRTPDPVPFSLGLLPVASSASGELLLPVADDEAFWIGVEAVGGAPVRVALAVGSGEPAVREVAGPDRIAGQGGLAFTRAAFECLRFATEAEAVVVRLVDYAAFGAATGREAPGPLDPRAGYRGWRLP